MAKEAKKLVVMLKQLTVEQQAVIEHQGGHARVRAVAGSGKTTTLVERVIYLLQQGVAAQRLLIVMYNRAARDDFSAKLQQRCQQLRQQGIRLQIPEVRTFHSLGHRLLQTLTRWELAQPRQLLQEEWQQDRLARQALTQLASQQGLSDQLSSWLEEDALDAFKGFCTLVKSDLIAADLVLEQLADTDNQKHFPQAFRQLEELLAEHQAMFFDDLIWRPAQILQQQPQVQTRLQGFVDYLIVDEYQDINAAQQSLLKSLAGQAQVMVVGDLDQCIYEWRGAKPEYMLYQFQQDFQPVADYPLSRTFRFGHSLALAANHAIAHNKERPPQLTLATPSSQPTLLQEGQGSSWLLRQLQQWQEAQVAASISSPRPAAILVRSWAQSLDIQLELLNKQQPFQLGRQEHFIFNRPQIRGILAYARLALYSQVKLEINYQHPLAQEDFMQLLSFPTLYLTQVEKNQLLHARIKGAAALQASLAQLPPGKLKKVKQRLNLPQELAQPAQQQTPSQFLDLVLATTQAQESIRKTSPSKESANEALSLLAGLHNYAKQSPQTSVQEWVEQLEQARQQGAANQQQQASQDLTILTVHAAKGLEWDWVGVYGLNEGDFPYTTGFARLTPKQEEAERRLFYVAITRAKQALVLARSNNSNQPSRFLVESALGDALQVAQALYLSSLETATLLESKPKLVEAKPIKPKLASQVKVANPQLAQEYWQLASTQPAPKFVLKS